MGEKLINEKHYGKRKLFKDEENIFIELLYVVKETTFEEAGTIKVSNEIVASNLREFNENENNIKEIEETFLLGPEKVARINDDNWNWEFWKQ